MILFEKLRQTALKVALKHDLKLQECGMGTQFTYAKITDAKSVYTGVCLTPKAEGSNGGFEGESLEDSLSNGSSYDAGKRAFALSCINAVSQYLLTLNTPAFQEDLRASLTQFILKNTKEDSNIIFIGHLQPVVKALKEKRRNVSVFCRQHTDVKNGIYNDIYEYEAIPKADILIITGATLLGSTIDAILHFAESVPIKVLAGFSAGTYPSWFQGSGITHLASVHLENIKHSTLLHNNLDEIFTYPCYISQV